MQAARSPRPIPAGRRRIELAELATPRPRPRDARLAAAVAAARQPRQGQAPGATCMVRATRSADEGRAFRRAMAHADNQARQRPDRRAALLRQAYGNVGWLPVSAVDNIEKIAFDPKAGAVHLLLTDGTKIRDDGRQVTFSGPLTSQAADELVAAARRRGWAEVELTGSQQFRDNMAVRLALAQPPIAVTNHRLSPELQQQVDDELARRAAVRSPQEQALDWLRDQTTARRRVAAELDQAREQALDYGARHDRAAENVLFALGRAERELAEHRRAQPAGLLAAITGRAAAWKAEEERRLEEARLLEAELADLHDRKATARAAAEGEAHDLGQQAREQRHQAEALERVGAAARRGDERAIKAATSQDAEACLRLAERLHREAQEEQHRHARQRLDVRGSKVPVQSFRRR